MTTSVMKDQDLLVRTTKLYKNWNSLITPTKLRYETVNNNPNIRTVIVEPLEQGFGLTLGNALRRVLLSSLRGAAITSIKIPGVEHELSPIPGVREDLTDVILNIRDVIIKMDIAEKSSLKLNVVGPAIITAGMLTCSHAEHDVVILNPDHIICNLNKGFTLEMDMTCEQGKGYVANSAIDNSDAPIGTIYIDAIFNPIKKVVYKVEHSRVGQVTNYDKLIMTIETNGVVQPDMALGIAARILQDQSRAFINFQEVEEEELVETPAQSINPVLLKRVDELELSVRSQNCLKNENIVYIGDLVVRTEAEMLKTPNFGRRSLHEIKNILSGFQLSFGMKDLKWPPENLEGLAKKSEDQY